MPDFGPSDRVRQQMPPGSWRMMPSHGDSPDPTWYRDDGSLKGFGYFGPLKLPNGGTATEYSIADSEKLKDAKGNYLDYPSLVPTLTRDEIKAVINAATMGSKLPDSVYDKAEAYALSRKSKGLPLFARPNEIQNLYPDMQRAPLDNYIKTNYDRMQPPLDWGPINFALGHQR